MYLRACKESAPFLLDVFMPTLEQIDQLATNEYFLFILPPPQGRTDDKVMASLKLLRYPNILIDLFNEEKPYSRSAWPTRDVIVLVNALGASNAEPVTPEFEKMLSYMEEFDVWADIATKERRLKAQIIEEREAQIDEDKLHRI